MTVSIDEMIRDCDERGAAHAAYLAAEPLTFDEPYVGYAPCPACFESSGYVWEHGNDWESGPWSHQTNTPCPECNGTGMVEADTVTLDDIEALDEAARVAVEGEQIGEAA